MYTCTASRTHLSALRSGEAPRIQSNLPLETRRAHGHSKPVHIAERLRWRRAALERNVRPTNRKSHRNKLTQCTLSEGGVLCMYIDRARRPVSRLAGEVHTPSYRKAKIALNLVGDRHTRSEQRGLLPSSVLLFFRDCLPFLCLCLCSLRCCHALAHVKRSTSESWRAFSVF